MVTMSLIMETELLCETSVFDEADCPRTFYNKICVKVYTPTTMIMSRIAPLRKYAFTYIQIPEISHYPHKSYLQGRCKLRSVTIHKAKNQLGIFDLKSQ